MTEAKEKALDLLCKMEIHTCPNGEQGRNDMTKQCALICVDEILIELKDEIWFSYCDDNNLDKREIFWQQVKQEILNL